MSTIHLNLKRSLILALIVLFLGGDLLRATPVISKAVENEDQTASTSILSASMQQELLAKPPRRMQSIGMSTHWTALQKCPEGQQAYVWGWQRQTICGLGLRPTCTAWFSGLLWLTQPHEADHGYASLEEPVCSALAGISR
jgi:hypothetical protein